MHQYPSKYDAKTNQCRSHPDHYALVGGYAGHKALFVRKNAGLLHLYKVSENVSNHVRYHRS